MFHRAEHVCQSLIERNWPAVFISGNIDQSKRNAAMSQLKQFKCRILVSTDLVIEHLKFIKKGLMKENYLDRAWYRCGKCRFGCEYGYSTRCGNVFT